MARIRCLHCRKPMEDCACDEEDECPRCGGEGYIEDDCFEDTCCCADPASSHGIVKCPTCQGTG